MALQFNTIGFINFNKDYNKVLKSGAITVSFTSTIKNKDGEYEKQYFNGLIPAKLAQHVKPYLNKELVKIHGIASPGQKGYINFTILEVEQYKKETKSDVNDNDLPF
ncbi:hypothetical protein [Streptococcus phage vB_SbRt-pBovineB21]|nr:hypothetical protein [Streptococcus phage vB_SbRt-pBovineB21]